MRIYLDSCVYQDLKKEKYQDLYENIIKSKGPFLYFYSKAHLYDLSRDKSDYKFEDMIFIETITDNNTINHKEDKFVFELIVPIQFYNNFDWDTTSKEDIIDAFADNSFVDLKELLSNCPLDFAIHDNNPINETLELGYSAFSNELLKHNNLYDFLMSFINYTGVLASKDDPEFKKLLQNLHQIVSFDDSEIVSRIAGFDFTNMKIIDKEQLKESYTTKILGRDNSDSYYDAFIKLYSGLEFYGLVKGKPKKQFLMNFINDSKHAAYGTCVDILVSKDKDFLEKTKFLYNLLDIPTLVLDIDEFESLLTAHLLVDRKSFKDVFLEIFNNDLSVIEEQSTDQGYAVFKKMNITYGELINTVCYIDDINMNKKIISLSVDNRSCLRKTAIKELNYLILCLIEDLGSDANGKREFDINEIIEGEWDGRIWQYGSFKILLQCEVFPYILLYFN